MKKTLRNYVLAFSAKVALEAACEETSVAVISRKYGVRVNQVGAWKHQVLDGVVGVFASSAEGQREYEDEATGLHAKIRELMVERDFLSKALKR